MTRQLLILSLVAALGAAPAIAQENADTAQTDAPAADTENAAPAPSVGGDLDLGEDETAAGNQPQTYIKETFDDWSIQCVRVQDENEVCQMYQLLKDANGASVAEVSIFKLENGGRAVAGGTFVVPLETLLPQKLSVSVDGGQAKRYDYSFCAPIGCYARVGFTEEDIQRFKAGAKATVTLVPAMAPDQKVSVEMSLSGFTAAFEQASALRQ